MTDRELLELAAKAAGITYNEQFGKGLWVGEFYSGKAWNPLTDEGDRYHLAKCLDIRLHFGPAYVTYVVAGISKLLRWPEDVPDDAYAIVRAAAEIGLSMK